MGSVEYAGAAFAPSPRSYYGVDALRIAHDFPGESAPHRRRGGVEPEFRFLIPLLLAAAWEAAFALESGGPLATWRN